MADLSDGLSDVLTDGSGEAVFDGDGATAATPITVTSDLDPFVERIRRDIHGAPGFLIEDFVKETLRDFTNKAWVLYQGMQVQGSGVATSTNKSVAWNMADYVSGLEPVTIKGMKVESTPYATQEKILATAVDQDSRYSIPTVKFYEIFKSAADGDKTNIRVYPFDADPLLYMMVAFKTLPDATEVPEILVDDWKEEICSGVMSKLMMQPGKEWTDPNLALFHKNIYQDGINSAKLKWFQNNSLSQVTGRKFI